MDRHRPRFLIVCLSLAIGPVLAACGQDLPVEFTVDARFSDHELSLIQQAADDWNLVTKEWLGGPALIYRGRFTDPEFDPYQDLNRDLDAPKLVYRGQRDQWLALLTDAEGTTPEYLIAAYNTETAVIVWPETCLQEGKDADICLRTTVRHEFGHSIGLAHLPDGMKGVMEPVAGDGYWPTIGPDDIRALCVVHRCLKPVP